MDAAVGARGEAGLSAGQQVSAFRGMIALCFGFTLAHTRGFSVSKAEAEEAWALWDPAPLENAGLPNLSKLAPQFLKTHADDDLRFMLNAYLAALAQNGAPDR